MAGGPDALKRDALERELVAERDEAQARAAALAEVLQAINASPQQPGAVFDMIIGKAMTLCDAAFGALLTYQDDHLTLVAHRNSPPAMVAYWGMPQYVDPSTATSLALREGRTVQIADLAESENYRKRLPMTVASVELAQIRTLVMVPLLGERGPIGLFILYRQEVRPFTDRQVTLVETFAAQAVLAMENARLFTEQREALEQQTATADILRVISQSPTDIAPVMTAVAKAAVRFCGAEDAHVFLRDGGEMVSSAHEGPLSAHRLGYRDALDASNTARADTILEARVTHLPDTLAPDAEAAYRSIRENSIQHGFRAQLNAPMLKDGQAIGCICLRRREPGPFTPRQIALLETFAAQAVIAIENVRLFTELKETLDQQTATAEILRAISESPTDVQPVLDVVVKAARRFCGAEDVVVSLREGDELAIAAHEGPIGAPPPRRVLDRSSAQGRAVIDARTVHLPNIAEVDPAEWSAVIELSRRIGAQASLAAPMVREGTAVGAIMLRRREPGPFSPRQIELLEIFAAQAVIALSNVRLFTELRESLEQQTASADVLRVISQSPTSVQPVFDVIAESALRLLRGWSVIVWRYDGSHLHIGAAKGGHPGSSEALPAMFEQFSPDDIFVGDAVRQGAVQRIVDVETADVPQHLRELARARGWRSNLAVPMMREGQPVGVFTLARAEPGAFTDRDVQLLQSFAAQAVIAIENVRLFTELRESLDYQTATSDVLSVISRSTSELEPVLRSMLAAATRLCGVHMGGVAVRRGDVLRYLTSTGVSAEFDKWLRATPHPIDRTSIAGRAALTKRVAYIPDLAADPDYAMPITTSVGNMRSLMAVPLLREDEVVGTITLGRSNTEPFTDRQIGLIRTFADQAVIAMENTRLLADLRESLDYQTATSEVLEVISRSTSDLAPVLNTMLAAAARLCGVGKGDVSIRRDGQMRYAASIGTTPAEDAWLRSRVIAADRSTCAGRAMVTRQVVHVLDQSADPELTVPRQISAHQTVLSVPLLREDEAIGVVTVLRDHVEAFTERQIALIKTFADQAVIAIENARLLGELRERTDDLTESLEYQTATSDLLEVISRSTSDIQPVLDRMLSSAARLCGVAKGDVAIRQGEVFRHVAFIGAATSEEDAWLRSRVTVPGRGTSTARALLDKQVDHVLDQSRDPERVAPAAATAARTTLAVPLLRDGEAIGVISLLRDHVEPFSERQIALVKTFADQAVIAMENARLLSELRERQNELRVTFDNMGDAVVMFDAERRLAAWNRNFQEMLDVSDSFLEARPTLDDYVRLLIGRGELGEVDIDSEMVRFRERFEQQWSAERTGPDGRILEVRNNPVPGGGAVLIYSDITERKKSEAAIRSARDAAEAALVQLKAAQANLVQSEKMASLGQLTAGIAHEIKNPLNFVNNFATLSVDLLDELKEIAGPALETLDEDKRAELDETMGLLTGNLGKIAEHGRRADGIVKSMLSHSRGGSGDWQASDINALVEEALNLAYHGARAQDKEFNVTLERDFETAGRPIEVVPQDVTRVFLNLFGNGFYAANKRRLAKEPGFRPTLKVTTRETGETVEVKVRDNGIGIPPEVREKLFQPFFTTKPTGEGTGLGLSISYDIVTQQHGGAIEVESEVGNFTEFTVRLPRIPRVASAKRA